MRLFWKIVREVGLFGLLRFAGGALRALLVSALPVNRALAAALTEDARRLRALPSGDLRWLAGKWIQRTPCGGHAFDKLAAALEVRSMMSGAAEAACCSDLNPLEMEGHMILAHIDSAFYRTYSAEFGSNHGKNDHWEWHLTPMHRIIGDYAVASLNQRADLSMSRARKSLQRILKERPWMTWVMVGSNVAGVNAGRALFALTEYIRLRDERMLREYIRSMKRFVKSARNAFDVVKDSQGTDVSIPNEGMLYGMFMWQAALYLAHIQKALRIWSIFNMPELAYLHRYMIITQVGDRFVPLGDSEAFEGRNPSHTFTALMGELSPYLQALERLTPGKHYLSGRINW